MIELSITVKDESSRLTEKDTVDEPYELSMSNDNLINRVRKVVEHFGAHPESESPDIVVKATMVWLQDYEDQ